VKNMTTFHQYWNGTTCAKLTADQICAQLLRKDIFYHRDWSISRWNLAFSLYYDGMATIKAFKEVNPYADFGPTVSVSRERGRLTQLMEKDIHDAAETGWGPGVSDLREAFEHLAANNDRWLDTNTRTYDGPLGRIHGLGPSCTTAQCAANFLFAYEERVKEIGEKLQQMKAGLSRAERLVKRVENSNTVGTQEWNEFGSCLGNVKTYSGQVEKSLWLLRPNFDPDGNTSGALELGENALSAIGSCLSAIALVRDTVDTYNKALSSGMTPEQGAALVAGTATIEGAGIAAGFVEGASTVVGGMAILLAVYAVALKAIPGIYQQFVDIVQRRDYLAAQLGVDLRTTSGY
jgi:hypothetical protein